MLVVRFPLGRTRGRAPLEPHDRRRGRAPFAAVSVVGERHDPEKCESELDDITSRTPMVKFLLEALSKAGCPVKREFFEVQYCSQAVLGGSVRTRGWCCVTTIS